MPKKIITLTEEMEMVVQREADRRGAPFASVVREAIREWAQRRGFTLEEEISWGGRRDAPQEDEGQAVAVAAG